MVDHSDGDVNTDKLVEPFTVKISICTKHMVDSLTPEWRVRLAQQVRITIARVIHEARFDPTFYLKSD